MASAHCNVLLICGSKTWTPFNNGCSVSWSLLYCQTYCSKICQKFTLKRAIHQKCICYYCVYTYIKTFSHICINCYFFLQIEIDGFQADETILCKKAILFWNIYSMETSGWRYEKSILFTTLLEYSNNVQVINDRDHTVCITTLQKWRFPKWVRQCNP